MKTNDASFNVYMGLKECETNFNLMQNTFITYVRPSKHKYIGHICIDGALIAHLVRALSHALQIFELFVFSATWMLQISVLIRSHKMQTCGERSTKFWGYTTTEQEGEH